MVIAGLLVLLGLITGAWVIATIKGKTGIATALYYFGLAILPFLVIACVVFAVEYAIERIFSALDEIAHRGAVYQPGAM